MAASLADKVSLIPIAFGLLCRTLGAGLAAPLTGLYGAASVPEYLINTTVRNGLGSLSPQQLQWLLPTFTATYDSWCKKKSIPPRVIEIPGGRGAKGMWVGNPDTAQYHLLWVHGGGWVMPGSEGHLDLISNFETWSNKKLAVMAVTYTLSPGAQYPEAIGQCVEALRYMLQQPEVKANRVLIGGDSAGGAIALAVLSHLSHPHPNSTIVKPLQVVDQLKGCMVISPWLSNDDKKYQSMTRMQYRDTFAPWTATKWSRIHAGDKSVPGDNYLWAANADAAWWQDAKTSAMLVAAGEDEILIDPILDFTEKYKAGRGTDQAKVVIGKGETHIKPILQVDDEGAEGTQTRGLKEWIVEHLS